jgi:hypothetical protein
MATGSERQGQKARLSATDPSARMLPALSKLLNVILPIPTPPPLIPKVQLRFPAGNGLCEPPYRGLLSASLFIGCGKSGRVYEEPEEEGGGACGD